LLDWDDDRQEKAMTQPSLDDLRAAVERNAQAAATGNFAQLMADVTPEALASLMQAAPAAAQLAASMPAGAAPGALPAITSYEIADQGPEGDGHVFHVTFVSTLGRATLAATWKPVLGQWKIVGLGLISAEANPGAQP
jgi:hypothetical protein